jgi:UDP:flavonoid glycosyltransferase YjiC (YdhE family)
MGLALELQARGHRPAFATLPVYRKKVKDAGLKFFPLRPDSPPPETEEAKEMIRRAMDLRDGPRYVMGELLAPHIRETYEDTIAAVTADGGTDLLVSHAVPMAAPIVAAKTGVKWISAVLSPVSLTSVYDPPTPPEFPWLRKLLLLHPALAKTFIRLLYRLTEQWVKPIRELRTELGLPAGGHPLFAGQHSPLRVLALFSSVLAQMQPDYPANTLITGFPFYDRNNVETPPRELMQFLESGEPPILFTLGSTAVRVGEDFFRTSIEAARQLKRRALLLVSDSGDLSASDLSNGIGVFDYAPYSVVMPRASVVVHQAGIGTTGQALRSGRPMLIVPHGQDQPDNARRCAELGVALVLPSKRYNVSSAVEKLRELLDVPDFETHAQKVKLRMRSENGTQTACGAIEEALTADPEHRLVFELPISAQDNQKAMAGRL